MTGGLLIDTNLLCLLIVGSFDRKQIGRHKRTRNFDPTDFDLVAEVVARSASVIVSPYVLAETSNLLQYTDNTKIAPQLQSILSRFAVSAVELHEPVANITSEPALTRLGLTDTILLSLATRNHLLFSDDRGLCYAAEARALRVVNFSYLREGALRLDQL